MRKRNVLISTGKTPVWGKKVSKLCQTQQSLQSRVKSVRKLLKTKENLEKTLKPIKELSGDKEDQVAQRSQESIHKIEKNPKGKSIFHK